MTAELFQLAGRYVGQDIPAGGMMCEQKIDGFRAGYFRGRAGKPGLWTRGGQPIEGSGHILHELAILEAVAGCSLFLDGEFVVDGSLAGTKAWCERGWRAGGEAGTFHLFDCLTDTEWRAGGTDRPLYQRKAWLAELRAAAPDHPLSWEFRPRSHGREPEGAIVEIMADDWVTDRADIEALANRVWMAGGEGLMLKDAEAPYRRGRSDAWLKVKHSRYVPGKGVQWKEVA
ncbi:MAG: ATP-dependent DNA ligase [Blastomonas fulva]|uniref:ATP-dependent DNA ligase n=1 Tax=Blastomonas fulva TaxID=1550728 RepID=UPI004034DB53